MKPKTIVKSDKPMTLKEMQDAVGGQIELVIDDGDTQIVCNEEGKMMGLPENEEATDLWLDKLYEQGRSTTDYLVGDVLVLEEKARME